MSSAAYTRKRAMRGGGVELCEDGLVSAGLGRKLTHELRGEPIDLRRASRYMVCQPFEVEDSREMYQGKGAELMAWREPEKMADWYFYLRASMPTLSQAGNSVVLRYFAELWPELDVDVLTAARRPNRALVHTSDYDLAPWPIEEIVGPDLPGLLEDVLDDAAETEVLRVAAEVRLGGSLEKLAGEAVDPWTGKGLRWERAGKEFGVWSVGKNGVDEEGRGGFRR